MGIDKVTGIRVHRYSYFIHNKEMNQELCVCHKCDNPICVKPEHLFLGTQIENIKDMIKKNRQVDNFTGNNFKRASGEKAGRAKLTKTQALKIRKLYADKKYIQSELARIYKVTPMAIYTILKNKSHKY